MGSALAVEIGLGGSTGGHNFSFNIPAQYIDGELHQIYAYVGTVEDGSLIPNSPYNYRAYTMTQGFQDYFNNTIGSGLNGGFQSGGRGCNASQCHGTILVDTFFYAIISPSPFDGGSGTNNLIYDKVSGGAGHNGGNFCNNNPSLCTQLQTWWSRQFP